MEVIIPTFINAHLFWIIPKRDILLRSAMHKMMSGKDCKLINTCEINSIGQMICLNIDGTWARGILQHIVTVDEPKYICWLPDYAVMRSVCHIYRIPENLQKCPPIARQATLNNVVNLTTDLMLGETGYEFKERKTTEEVMGVIKSALDLMESTETMLFSPINEIPGLIYGDIICVDSRNVETSLTEMLLKQKLLAVDEDLFKTMENKRTQFRDAYFQNSASWRESLDKVEKGLSGIIFNKDKSIGMNFFQRTADSNRQ